MNAVLSPRFRYRYLARLVWGLAIVGIGVGAYFIGHDVLGNKPAPTSLPPVKVVKPAPHPPKNVPLDRHVRTVAAQFIQTAVRRQHLARSWDLVSPRMKTGFTKQQWAKGAIPVVPFPAELVKYKVVHSYRNDALLEVALFPKPGSQYHADVFMIQLHRYRTPGHARWLVTYWAPEGRSAVPATAN